MLRFIKYKDNPNHTNERFRNLLNDTGKMPSEITFKEPSCDDMNFLPVIDNRHGIASSRNSVD